MLTDLIIRNFAIIDRVHVRFGAGFNVLTGETGAGKSIIIDAVGLLLGDRARPDLIRAGEDEAVVEGMFDISRSPGLCRELSESGFDSGTELVVRRLVARNGKNRVYVNGSLATLGQLQEITAGLMIIYGQHEQQSLQKIETHLDLLDRIAGAEGEFHSYCQAFARIAELKDRLFSLDEAERDRQRRLDMLLFQSREISEAAVTPKEEEELISERLLLQNAERLAAATRGGYDLLYGEEGAVVERLDEAAAALEALSGIDADLDEMAKTVRSSQYALEDIAANLRNYAGKIDFEPGRQNAVEERLARISSLKKKYAPTVEEILVFKERIDREIEELSDLEASRETLQGKLAAAEKELRELGEALSMSRRDSAHLLSKAVEKELRDLVMEKARFEVRISPLSQPGPRGLETIEFYLSPNPGEGFKQLARVASGGELSRIMLALKRAVPQGDGTATLIFDEVDAGIGGVAASAVGEKLHGLAGGFQVLCVTHLPQVAAFADSHYRVEKREADGRTLTDLIPLNGEERIGEMARMLGGAQVTERTWEHAREMISRTTSRSRSESHGSILAAGAGKGST